MVRLSLRFAFILALICSVLWSPALARADEPSAFDEVLRILKKGGLIDEAGEQKVQALYAAEQKKKSSPKWLDGFEFNGDLRLRYDGQFYRDDALGNDPLNRSRGRYRARFGFAKHIGDRLSVGIRLATSAAGNDPANPGNARSTNLSFGEGSNHEFKPGSIFFDRAWFEYKLQNSDVVQTRLVAGKLENPYRNSVGTDILMFDPDLNPEGAFLATSFRPTEATRIYLTGGGFVINEAAGGKDPKFVGEQLGFESKLSRGVRVGLRASAYQFRQLDANFLDLARSGGNLPSAFGGTLVDPATGLFSATAHGGKANIGDVYGFMQLDFVPSWPIVLWATAIKNFSARSGLIRFDPDGAGGPLAVGDFQVHGAQDEAFGLGFELGDATRLFKFGLGYFRVEANSVISQFTDDDLLEGINNRQGYMFFATRKLNPNAELRLTIFNGRDIQSLGLGSGPFVTSLRNAKRTRVFADVVFSF